MRICLMFLKINKQTKKNVSLLTPNVFDTVKLPKTPTVYGWIGFIVFIKLAYASFFLVTFSHSANTQNSRLLGVYSVVAIVVTSFYVVCRLQFVWHRISLLLNESKCYPIYFMFSVIKSWNEDATFSFIGLTLAVAVYTFQKSYNFSRR